MAKRPFVFVYASKRQILIAAAILVIIVCLVASAGIGLPSAPEILRSLGSPNPESRAGAGNAATIVTPANPGGSASLTSPVRSANPAAPAAPGNPVNPTDPAGLSGRPGLPLADLLIVLDPGHGGEDRGVCYFPDDLIEKEINLDVARRLKGELEKAGARVLLTRETDTYLSLDERAEIANSAGADLFLSLHVNRIPGHPDCFGAQTFYFPDSKEGERLARFLQEELVKIDPENYRSPLAGSYRVLRLTTMPGALVEIGFMTSSRDRELLASLEYRDRVAVAITQGVVRYFTESPPPGP